MFKPDWHRFPRLKPKEMIEGLRGVKILDGVRGQDGIDKDKFAEIIVRLSQLVAEAPVIAEMDLNPLLGTKDKIIAVDARIRVEKSYVPH